MDCPADDLAGRLDGGKERAEVSLLARCSRSPPLLEQDEGGEREGGPNLHGQLDTGPVAPQG